MITSQLLLNTVAESFSCQAGLISWKFVNITPQNLDCWRRRLLCVFRELPFERKTPNVRPSCQLVFGLERHQEREASGGWAWADGFSKTGLMRQKVSKFESCQIHIISDLGKEKNITGFLFPQSGAGTRKPMAYTFKEPGVSANPGLAGGDLPR